MSLLGQVYPNEAGPAFAIFKFISSLSASLGFAYSGYIPLYWHCGMLGVLGLAVTFFYVKVDLEVKRGGSLQQEVNVTQEKANASL